MRVKLWEVKRELKVCGNSEQAVIDDLASTQCPSAFCRFLLFCRKGTKRRNQEDVSPQFKCCTSYLQKHFLLQYSHSNKLVDTD